MYDYGDAGAGFGFSIGFIIFGVIFGLLIYALYAWFLMKVFDKMNIEGWKAWVPIYNSWVFLEAGGYPGWIALLTFASIIPFVGWLGSIAVTVFLVMAAYRISIGFGKSGAWAVLFFFLQLVWTGILAFDSSKWRGLPDGATPGPTAKGAAVGVAPYSTTGYQAPQQGFAAPGQQPGGYQAPGQAQGYQAPQAGGYQAPGQQPGGYQAPQQAQGYQAPGQQSGGYQAPQAGGYQAPGQPAAGQQSGGYQAPGQSQGYQAPQAGGYQAPGQPAAGQQPGGYQAPSQSQGYQAPQAGGYQAPGSSADATDAGDSNNPYGSKPDGSNN